MAGTKKDRQLKGDKMEARQRRRKGKCKRQMWVNENDNGRQWCMARMIVFRGPCQIDWRTELY